MSLRDALSAAFARGGDPEGRLIGASSSVTYADLAAKSGLGAGRASLDGASVLVRTRTQIAAAQALVELDGLARRLVLCPPDLDMAHLDGVIDRAGIDAVVTDDDAFDHPALPVHRLTPPTAPVGDPSSQIRTTEWLMFTSGTTGAPKMVIHTLGGLTGAIGPRRADAAPIVWGTFYDIRRYGGLQILLRALTWAATMVLSDADEPMGDFLGRVAAAGVTHQSGTPSHWRWALMNPELGRIQPRYVRLSGEIADQAVLDSLKAFFPNAAIGHAYASTEAGVGFEVTDGLEGFPAAFVGTAGPVEMKVEDGSLRIRSDRTASAYAGHDAVLIDADGFVDSDDMVELRGDRYYFAGRRGGIINIGGLKVHPEEIEAVINRHPAVHMSLVRARRSPITGALVVADIVLTEPAKDLDPAALKAEILAFCREGLAAYKAPSSVKFVSGLAVTAGGKLDRQHA
jgi:acyl-coenzyme A synthetase/AMP-(fatty) acid ligase